MNRIFLNLIIILAVLSFLDPSAQEETRAFSEKYAEACENILIRGGHETLEQLRQIVERSPMVQAMVEGIPAKQRLSLQRIADVKLVMSNLDRVEQLEILRAYIKTSLIQIGDIPDTDGVASAMAVLHLSKNSIDQIFARNVMDMTHQELVAVSVINRLRQSGYMVDLNQGTFEVNPAVHEVAEKNINAFINPRAFVREDWKLGVAMDFPTPTWRRPFATRPSRLAEQLLVNRDGKAYVGLKVYDPDTEKFVMREYPVVRLSKNGNPVVLIHPRSHILVPTQSRVQNMTLYGSWRRSMAAVTLNKPVQVNIYNGYQHLGYFSQLIVFNDGHHRAYSAWSRQEPMHVELTGGSSYYPFSVTWGTIKTW